MATARTKVTLIETARGIDGCRNRSIDTNLNIRYNYFTPCQHFSCGVEISWDDQAGESHGVGCLESAWQPLSLKWLQSLLSLQCLTTPLAIRRPPQATLTGHSLRVLYLAASPDGQTIVTGAGDETLRFWSVFPGGSNGGRDGGTGGRGSADGSGAVSGLPRSSIR